MIELLLLRHGITQWNRDKRLQGRRDIPLSEQGQSQLTGLSIPAQYRQRHWLHSPLQRCIQTATALELDAQPCQAWIEMDWGDWEGQRISDLRRQHPEQMAVMEQMGLDLLPPGGESPRQVKQRLLDWLAQQPQPQQLGIITHKGVIRALLSQALDWDMQSKCPVKIDWTKALLLGWQPEGDLQLMDYNIALDAR